MRMNQGDIPSLDSAPIVRTDLSTTEAAVRLGISESTVRRRIRQGVLPAVKVAGLWRITLVDVAEPEPIPHPARRTREPVRSADEPATGPLAADAPAADLAAALREAFLQPVVAQLAAQAEEIGRLRAERDHLRAEVERLDSRLTPEQFRRRVAPDPDPFWHIVRDGKHAAWLIGGLVGAIVLTTIWWRRQAT